MKALHELSIAEIHTGYLSGAFSCEELVTHFLNRIKAQEALNAFVTLTEERALEEARAVDARLAKGEPLRALEGIPVAVKDIFNVKGVRTTAGSKMLEHYISPYESTTTARLWQAGAILLGKNNNDEFACGSSNETSYYGPVKNPWDTSLVPGGSSGGSAVSVAARQAVFSVGTDTGGSIRQPAALTGVFGMKVSYGRTSRYGVIAMASSWDTIGPFTHNVEDMARVMQVISGKDERDATMPNLPVPNYLEALASQDVKGLRIGVPAEYFGEGVDAEVEAKVREALALFEQKGAVLVPVTLPMTKYGVAIYYATMPAELSTNLAKFDGLRFGHKTEKDWDSIQDFYKYSRGEGFGPEIKRRIMVGTFLLSAGYADAYYKKALQVRTLVIEEFNKAFEQVDVMIAPVSPTPAFALGAKTEDPLAMYMADALTIPANAAGIPALSQPCGFTAKGLPVAFQIMGPSFKEEEILRVAMAYQSWTNWHEAIPTL